MSPSQVKRAQTIARAEEFSAKLGSACDLFLSAQNFPYIGSKIGQILEPVCCKKRLRIVPDQ